MQEKTVIVTGFGPLRSAGDTVNPAFEVAKALDGKLVAGHRIIGVELPNDYAMIRTPAKFLPFKANPAVILGLGVSGTAKHIKVERVALNRANKFRRDDKGADPGSERLFDEGEQAYWATLPVDRVVDCLLNAGIPAWDSQDAGDYLCNAFLYSLLRHLEPAEDPAPLAGFFHLPLLPEQAAMNLRLWRTSSCSSMSLPLMIKGVRLGLEASLTR